MHCLVYALLSAGVYLDAGNAKVKFGLRGAGRPDRRENDVLVADTGPAHAEHPPTTPVSLVWQQGHPSLLLHRNILCEPDKPRTNLIEATGVSPALFVLDVFFPIHTQAGPYKLIHIHAWSPVVQHYLMSGNARAKLRARVKTPGMPVSAAAHFSCACHAHACEWGC